MIWVILIIMLVILLAGIFYEGFLMITYPIYDFFFHTRWGLMAIIFLALSYIFSFISKRTYEDVSIKDEMMNSFKQLFKDLSKSTNYINKQNKLKKMDEKYSIIDFKGQNIDGVLKQLAKSINQPFPVLFKGLGNSFLAKDIERVRLLTENIKAVRGFTDEFIEMQVDALFAKDKVRALLEERENSIKNAAELLNKEHWHKIKSLDLDISIKEEDLKTKQLLNKRIEIENNKSDLETKMIELRTLSEIKLLNVRTNTLERLFDLYKNDQITYEFVLAFTKLIDPRANLGLNNPLPDEFVNLAINKGLAEIDILQSQKNVQDMNAKYRNEEVIRENIINQYNNWKMEQNKKKNV